MKQFARLASKLAVRRRAFRLIGLAFALLAVAMALPATASAFVSTGDGTWVWQNPLPQGTTSRT